MIQQFTPSLQEIEEQESNYHTILSIDGPLITVENMPNAEIYEVVRIGQEKLLGEIIKLKESATFIQCFEDTSGLSVGDPVIRTRSPFSIELGPGIFTQVFDGIQRRLQINQDGSFFYGQGQMNISALDHDRIWEFKPSSNFKEGKLIYGGDIYGSVFENNLFDEHKIMVNPLVQGRVTYIAPEGNYTLKDNILEVEIEGIINKYGMSHFWPVRQKRPIVEKLEGNTPLLTGIRVLDGLYPSVQGGTCCASVSSIGGKIFISQSISKNSNSNCNIYVGCGENEFDIFRVIDEFYDQKIPIKDHQESIAQKTCLISNSSKMVTPTTEISVFTGITIGEYFRDMGLNVSFIVDSTNQWSQAVNQIQEKLGEILPSETQSEVLTAKIGQFYNRAGRVRCLGSPERIGSITMVGIATQSEGDWANSITNCTINNSQVFWLLDKRLSQRNHFPTFDRISSNSKYEQLLDPYYSSINPEFNRLKEKLQYILSKELELIKIIQLGEKPLLDEQQLSLEINQIIIEQFIYQNTFNDYDDNCPLPKTIGMMKCIVTFYECAQKAIQDEQFTWNLIKQKAKDQIYKLNGMKFYKIKKSELENHFNNFANEIQFLFKNLQEG
ncbi:unnamed protein product (macronuclear) [Paramecium tetraurelia]|uniref:H(+)-transporting two-sector ATPase n=1 Tax=Paramecium tetraurelia TaxID=5888 RepID=A0E2E9_PARTE|nr:uncharacterized protein GSPATT00022638001 [Paramecium tetraurelia]CAK89466.1 unnamed protein product [Paramecium tetraurelia]|eukprot:XP_001456863.1 hypothetical protein (macronuclear) [Paramecium tetraurelia strain d4-2]